MINEPYAQIPMFPCYRIKQTGECFFSLQEATINSKSVTFDPDHYLIRRPGNIKMPVYAEYSRQLQAGIFARPTFFEEIEAVPPRPAPGIQQMYGRTFGQEEIGLEQLARLAVEAITGFIERSWEPDRIHVMPHSSGFDSRLISAILRRLGEKNGMDWLGQLYFVCWQPEIPEFLRLMVHFGWPARMIIPVYPWRQPEDYYRDILDFDFIGRNYCEAERFWAGPSLGAMALNELGVGYDEELRGIGALFSDETGKANRLGWPDVGFFAGCYFFDNPSPWLGSHARFMFPFVSGDYLEIITRYRIPVGLDFFKRACLKLLDPALIDNEALPNARFRIGPVLSKKGYHAYQAISEKTRLEMAERFLASWYCRKFKKDEVVPFPPVLRYYDEKTTEYIKAAIVNYLIGEGCEINAKSDT